ncbi:hypothetical protein [Raineyella antarctica]|uniref:hypothetical protein n=1 Tax=Raineyella antarctica TaxID=1577474 RepID=UPI001114D981|nr:hypothetical protein [Raineyella antarctica]
MDTEKTASRRTSDLPSGRLLTPRTVAPLGLTAHELRSAHRLGQMVRLRRGVYAKTADLDPVQRHHLRILAAKDLLDESAVLSHVSAAVWRGLDVPWAMIDDRVHVTRGIAGGSIRERLATHTGQVPDDQWTVIDGLRVTTVARTVVDLARVSEVKPAVALADRVLRQDGADASRTEMQRILGQSKGRRGVGQARWVVGFADPRAESGGESVSRVVLESLGVPTPELQFEVRTVRGALIGRTDFAWPRHRTLGEFDGRVKYRRLPAANGEDPGEVVFREKRREDRLRAAGWEVVRWTWDELARPEELEQELRQAFLRGEQRWGADTSDPGSARARGR